MCMSNLRPKKIFLNCYPREKGNPGRVHCRSFSVSALPRGLHGAFRFMLALCPVFRS